MLYDEATIRVIPSTSEKDYVEKPLRLVCYPVNVSASGYIILVDNAVEALIDETPPLATLITQNTSEAELVLSPK